MTRWLGDRWAERRFTGSLPAGRVEHSRAWRFEVTLRASSSTSCHLHFHTLRLGTAADPVPTPLPPRRKLSSWTISQHPVARKTVCLFSHREIGEKKVGVSWPSREFAGSLQWTAGECVFVSSCQHCTTFHISPDSGTNRHTSSM